MFEAGGDWVGWRADRELGAGRHVLDSMNAIVKICILMKEFSGRPGLYKAPGCLINANSGEVNPCSDCAIWHGLWVPRT